MQRNDQPERHSAFGRESRLRNHAQFSQVREGGNTHAGRFCIVNVLTPSPDGENRAGFSISKRYSKLAVERNRARRLFREAYRCVYEKCSRCWVVFVPRRAMLKARLQDILPEVEAAFDCLSEETR